MRRVIFALFLGFGFHPSALATDLTRRQTQALDEAVQLARNVLGQDHELSLKLASLRLKGGIFFETTSRTPEGGSLGGAKTARANPWTGNILIDKNAWISLEETTSEPFLRRDDFWTFFALLIHEAIHLAYGVADPEAGRLTAQIILRFAPNQPGPGVSQPNYHYRSMTCEQLRRIHDVVTEISYSQVDYSLSFTNTWFGTTGKERFAKLFEEYRSRKKEIDGSDKSPREKDAEKRKLRSDFDERYTALARHWNVNVSTCADRFVEALEHGTDFENLKYLSWLVLYEDYGEEMRRRRSSFTCDP